MQEWYEFNRETVQALLDDGSQAEADYQIEFHISCTNFERLEKAAVDAFKLGFEVGDAEELILDDGSRLFCFDAVVMRKLDVAQLDKDTEQLVAIATKHQVHYDGWGTHFIE